MPPSRLSLPTARDSILLLCDIQEKFRPLIWKFQAVVNSAKTLHRAATLLGCPTLVTEQNPGRLGPTVRELEGLPTPLSKMKFSMITDDAWNAIVEPTGRTEAGGVAINQQGKIQHAILCGIEGHVCVQQTALELLSRDIQVHLVVDGVSSQRRGDRAIALANLTAAGAAITTTEAIIFQLLGSASHPNFKDIQRVVIDHNKTTADGPEEGRGLDVLA